MRGRYFSSKITHRNCLVLVNEMFINNKRSLIHMKKNTNSLAQIFTETNLKILDRLAIQEFYIRELAEQVKCSPAAAHKAVKLFKQAGFIKEKHVKNRVVIALNYENVLLQKVRSLINIYRISRCMGFKELRKFGTVGVYGSFAFGKDDIHSDVDIWVYTEAPHTDLYTAVLKVEQAIRKEIHLTIISKKRLASLRKNDPVFYSELRTTSVRFGEHVFV